MLTETAERPAGVRQFARTHFGGETELMQPPIPHGQLTEEQYVLLWNENSGLAEYRAIVERLENLARMKATLFGGIGTAHLPIGGHQGRFATGAAPTVPQLIRDKLIEQGPLAAKEIAELIGKTPASVQNALSSNKGLFKKAEERGKWVAAGE